MPTETLEFEESLAPLLKEVDALSALPRTDARERELERLNQKLRNARTEIYGRLTPWQRVLVSRHPSRPDMLDTSRLFTIRRAARDRRLRTTTHSQHRLLQRKPYVWGIQGGCTSINLRNFGYSRPKATASDR